MTKARTPPHGMTHRMASYRVGRHGLHIRKITTKKCQCRVVIRDRDKDLRDLILFPGSTTAMHSWRRGKCTILGFVPDHVYTFREQTQSMRIRLVANVCDGLVDYSMSVKCPN